MSRFRTFVIEQKCIPYKFRPWLKTYLPRPYLYITYGSSNANTRSQWDKIWASEGLGTWRTYPNRFERIAELVGRERGAIVDVGCGVGVLLGHLKEKVPSNDLTGVDISEEAVKVVRQLGFEGIRSELPHLPLESERFDVVLLCEVLEHLNDPEATVSQAARILKPSGRIIVTVPDDRLSFVEEDQHVHVFNKDSLKDLLERFFDLQSVEVVNDEWVDKEGHGRKDSCYLAYGIKKTAEEQRSMNGTGLPGTTPS